MTREHLDKYCDYGILGTVIAILGFAPLATGAVRAVDFLVVQALAVLAAILWLARCWLGQQRLMWPPVCSTVLAFVAYAILRYFSAEIEFTARMELIRIVVYAITFFVVLNNLNRFEHAHVISLVLIALALANAGYAIYQFAAYSPKVWHFTRPLQYGHRAGGTFINPNHLAGFLEIILPLTLAYVLMGRFSHVTKIVLGYAALVMLAGIAVTLSRGGWLATVLMLVIFFAGLLRYREFRLKASVMLAILFVLGSAFLANATWSKRRIDLAFRTGQLEDARLQFWRGGMQMWKDHLWFGVGPGHFDAYYARYRQPIREDQHRPVYAHNDYLNVLADWGIVGALLISGTFALVGAGVFKTWPNVYKSADLEAKRSSRRSRAAFLYGAALGLIGLLLHELVEFNLQIPGIAVIVIALIALISSHRRYETDRYFINVKLLHKSVITVLVGIAVAFLVQHGIRRVRESVWLMRAQRAELFSEKLSALKMAANAETKNFETTYKIGELLRTQSWQGNDDYQTLAEEALVWFRRGIELNPLDPYNYLRAGMCLDWIGKHMEAAPFFEKALELDPNSYYFVAFQGWHLVQVEAYAEAKKRFERSLQIYDNHTNRNAMPVAYLEIVNRKLTEATNATTAK